MSKYEFDQLRYDPTTESFTDFLTKFNKTAKQAYGAEHSVLLKPFLFAKHTIQLQKELPTAGKHNATLGELKKFVHYRCQYPQLLLGTSGMQPSDQAFNYQPKQQNAQPASNHKNADKTNTTEEVKRRFEGTCRYCNILGHKWIDCRKRLRDEANGINTKTQQRPLKENNNGQQQQPEKPRYNLKLVCQICGKVGHSARDCRNRVPRASAYRNVPYEKQSTTQNRE